MNDKLNYSSDFFAYMGDGPDDSSIGVLQAALQYFVPNSFVDIGCGTGKWVATALMLGIKEAIGVDGPYISHDQLLISRDIFVERDLEVYPLTLGRRFDLAISLEVAEHLSRARSESFVTDLCALSDVVLFSAAPPFQGGTHHLNEQWLEYWGILFRKNGYVPVDVLRDKLWVKTKIAWYYRQNLMFFCTPRKAEELFPREYIAENRLLSRIHPEMMLALISKFWPFMYGKAYYEETYHYHLLANAWLEGAIELPQAGHRASAFVQEVSSFSNTELEHTNEDTNLNNRVYLEHPIRFQQSSQNEITVTRR